jgi:peptidoglycan/xylan/chitin deacetylase (PgdA/CDA1 family)
MLGWLTPYVFLGAAQRRLMIRGLPVLNYHKLGTPPPGTRDPFLYVRPAEFDAQLAALRQLGYVSSALDAFCSSGASPHHQAVITFDDGCRSVLELGLDALSRHQFRAIQFLVAGMLGQRNEWDIRKGDSPEALMDEAQVRAWLQAGHEIGSHSMTHPNLRHLSPAEAREEIFASKKSIEDRFGLEVRHFCYPYGSWNPAVRDLVAEAGYATACTMRFGVSPLSADKFQLSRIVPLSSSELLAKIAHRLARKIRRR